MIAQLTGLCLLFARALAVPALSGYSVTWSDEFDGPLGGSPGGGWSRVVRTPSENANDEQQFYTEYSSNGQLWGDGQLFITPDKRGSNPEYWTSARFETTGAWNCPAGKAMIFQADLRGPDFTGNPANLQGIWPAFWALGNACRNGGSWPDCGEWDIFETINDLGDRNQANVHYKRTNGGHESRSGSVQYTGGQYHTWAIKVDRRNSDWNQQKLIWYKDGTEYLSVTGASIGDFKVWEKLAYKSFYIILNVAVGGDDSYGGKWTSATIDGTAAALRVKYVAVYHSN
ncbi:Beta-glucanase [Dactylellina cionopaga]|nr:Beta-glucanase [Dactylellina cionopaga]